MTETQRLLADAARLMQPIRLVSRGIAIVAIHAPAEPDAMSTMRKQLGLRELTDKQADRLFDSLAS